MLQYLFPTRAYITGSNDCRPLMHYSLDHLETRYMRLIEMQRADKQRFRPNPRGDGYLTRNERWHELIWLVHNELGRRYHEAGLI